MKPTFQDLIHYQQKLEALPAHVSPHYIPNVPCKHHGGRSPGQNVCACLAFKGFNGSLFLYALLADVSCVLPFSLRVITPSFNSMGTCRYIIFSYIHLLSDGRTENRHFPIHQSGTSFNMTCPFLASSVPSFASVSGS